LIAAMFPHPNYNPGKDQFDIMIFKTVSPFLFTKEVRGGGGERSESTKCQINLLFLKL